MTSSTSFDPFEPMRSAPGLILPDPARVFLDRSRRFAVLAQGHSLSDWLTFLGRVSEAQHRLLENYPPLSAREESLPASEGKGLMPPIPASMPKRDPSWRRTLIALAAEIAPHAPPAARETLDRLRTMDGDTLEGLADQVLLAEPDREAFVFLPFVSAALQVHWTALAAGLDRATIAPAEEPGVCPICGFLPVAGMVRTDGEVPGLRYLHCGLCNTEWNLVRVTCATCGDGTGMAYHHIEGTDGSVRAETCDACRTYLKIISQEKSPKADPVADDLATLSLDLLVEEAGYSRASPNLLLGPYPSQM